MTPARTSDPVGLAKADVLRIREQLLKFQHEIESARVALAELEARAGAEAIDTPGSGPKNARLIAELQAQITISGRAIEELSARLVNAEATYLLAEALLLDAPVAAAKERLAKHEVKTAELLQALVDHDGPYVPEEKWVHERRANKDLFPKPTEWTIPTSAVIANEIEQLEIAPAALRSLAAGENPGIPLSEYPACVTEDVAVVNVGDLLERIGPAPQPQWTNAPWLGVGPRMP